MDTTQLTEAFDALIKEVQRSKSEGPNLNKQDQNQFNLILMGAVILREFLVDHKRSADALVRLAGSVEEMSFKGTG